jgi:hypothetical protein
MNLSSRWSLCHGRKRHHVQLMRSSKNDHLRLAYDLGRVCYYIDRSSNLNTSGNFEMHIFTKIISRSWTPCNMMVIPNDDSQDPSPNRGN